MRAAHSSLLGWYMYEAEFLRDLVAKEVLRLEHISGTYMLADLLTKAVSRPIFLQLMELLNAYARTGVSALHS